MPSLERQKNSSATERSQQEWPSSQPRLCNRKPFAEYTEEDWAKLKESQEKDAQRLSEALPEHLAGLEK
jgi:hypothetical protein